MEKILEQVSGVMDVIFETILCKTSRWECVCSCKRTICIFCIMTWFTPLCLTLLTRDSKAVELLSMVGTNLWCDSCQSSCWLSNYCEI